MEGIKRWLIDWMNEVGWVWLNQRVNNEWMSDWMNERQNESLELHGLLEEFYNYTLGT